MTQVIAPPKRQRAARKRPRVHNQENAAGWLMSAPALLLLLAFVLVPFVMAFVLSMQNVRLDGARPNVWMGLEQYRRILLDPLSRGVFYRSLLNNFLFALFVVPVQTALAVALATMLNQKLKGIAIFRTFFFLPVVFPMALVATIWSLIFARGSLGMLNGLIHAMTLGLVDAQDWLGDPKLALLSIAIMSIWAGVGFQMIIVLAGLQNIPTELYEAAALDRAGRWAQFRHVTLPGLRNTLIFVVIVTTIFSFRLFDQVYIMTRGGPNNTTSTVMYQAVTSAFIENNVGKGSAMTVVFVLVIVIVTLVQQRVLKQEREVQ
ncbi:MAG: sugar ABC transporter permease [Nocardioidaceae bacterium]